MSSWFVVILDTHEPPLWLWNEEAEKWGSRLPPAWIQKSSESLCVDLMPIFTLFCKLLFFFQSHCLTFEVVELLEFLQAIPIPYGVKRKCESGILSCFGRQNVYKLLLFRELEYAQ